MTQLSEADLLSAILAESREIDSKAAHLRGRLRSFREEVEELESLISSLERSSVQLRQKALSLNRAMRDRELQIVSHIVGPDLTVKPTG